MNIANISYTRNHLCKLLDRVKEGETVLIVDRNRPVARLLPPGDSDASAPDWKATLVRNGVLQSATHKLTAKVLKAMPLPVTKGGSDALSALLMNREEDR